MAARKKGRLLFWLGLLLACGGVFGQLAARKYVQETPMLYMGAAMARLFESTAHLTLQEKAVLFMAHYGLHVALAGGVLAFIALVRRQ